MNTFNTAERNIQIVLALLKGHGIKKAIVSPGSTDIAIVASMQHDPYFELYSCVDERSACYMATGMCAELNEPVVIICTGATSSRNYLPGLTEAFYRHLPILAITCCKSNANVGHYVNQVTDRSSPPSDTINCGVYVQTVRSAEDEWDCMVKVNKAILGLRFNGGGPCHINLETVYKRDFTVEKIPPVRVIRRYGLSDRLPALPKGKIGVFVGNFPRWPQALTQAVDRFCELYNAVVFCDQTSNYRGKYGVLYPLIAEQEAHKAQGLDIDLMIHIGYVSAISCKGKEMWRVNPDGELRDTFRKTTCIFQMTEQEFFERYNAEAPTAAGETTLYQTYAKEYSDLVNIIPELPFSNLWVAQHLSPYIPKNSVVHLGICNSLRSWNNFQLDNTVSVFSNTGGFGIDGGISSLVGASMADPNKLYFGFFGDLLFFYDMNSLGIRHIMPNMRILVINNGLGQEFKNHSSFGALFKEDTNEFISAKGHYGDRKSPVIKSYAESLGYEYLCAASKEEFLEKYQLFVQEEIGDKPMLFEVFTESADESEALDVVTALTEQSKQVRRKKAIAGTETVTKLKNIAKRILR